MNVAAADQERNDAWRLQSQGRLAEAEAAYRRLVERDPGDFESWNNLGNVHVAAGELEAAVAALEQAASLRPDLPMIRLNLAGALARAGRLQESLAQNEKAARDAPDDLACLVELSRAHARLGQHDSVLAPLDRALALHPGQPGLLVELGLAQAGRGAFAEAEAAYREAIRHQPGFAPAWLYLGILLEHSNRADELAPLLDSAEANRVPAAELALIRAFMLRRQGDFAGALAAAHSVPPGIEPLRRAQLIGESIDRLGDSAAAFEAFAAMNRIALAGWPAAREAAAVYRSGLDQRLAGITPDWYASWTPAAPPPERASPIFLMGFPRSGTTLLDTLLMGHSRLHIVEEKPLLQPVREWMGAIERLAGLTEEELALLREVYFDTLDAEDPPPPGKRVVDKMPLNIAELPVIHRLFPDARIILALRHPCDVVLSCFTTNFGLNRAMANFLDLGDAARLYDLVMRCWTRCSEVFPLQVHELRYEDLVEDPEAAIRPLLDFLGLDCEAAMLDHRRAAASRGYVASASYAQVTEPLYDRSRGRWTRYREQLREVIPLLSPWVERFGYSL